MNKIRKLLFSCTLLLLPSLAYAVPVTEFVDTLFIGGGVMLFLAGVLLLLVPGLFKTGVLITLMADVLFMLRMLFPDVLEKSLSEQPDWQPLIDTASTGGSRIYAATGVAIIVISTLSLRWLLKSIFGTPTVNNSRANTKSATAPVQPQKRAYAPSVTPKVSGRNRNRLNRDRDDFSGYTEEPEPQPDPVSPAHNKRFRVHDYLENLEQQQAQPTPPPRQQEAEPAIHFDRIER